MMRSSLKRQRDIFDSSPASSTPPQRAKLAHRDLGLDSDASTLFSSPYRCHVPSDSPSNPFGRFKPFTPRALPRSTRAVDHFMVRFQLGQARRNVYRVVSVPSNYTFWHLAKLTQFLFGWKDTRKERSSSDKHKRVDRKVDHIFTIQKRVQFYPAGKNPGLFKGGSSQLRVASNIKELKPRCEDSEVPWEREEVFTLNHLWHRPGNASDLSRAVIYEYDVLSALKESVYISLSTDLEKINPLHTDPLTGADDLSNTPLVIQGQGLPDDDDDDEDFPLDLEQWNEPSAFENHLFGPGTDEEEDDEDNEDEFLLEKEQDVVRKRMKAPLPKRLPVDEDPHAEDEDDAPSRYQQAQALVSTLGKTAATKPFPTPAADIAEEDGDAENKPPPTAPARSPLKKRRSNVSDTDARPSSDVEPTVQKSMAEGKSKLVFPRANQRQPALAALRKAKAESANATVALRAKAKAKSSAPATRRKAVFRSLNQDESEEDVEGSEVEVDQLDSEAEI